VVKQRSARALVARVDGGEGSGGVGSHQDERELLKMMWTAGLNKGAG